MKIQKIKNFGKKFFASITLAIFTMGIFSPLASAQQRWQVSSLNKTFFEIPPDDRNLEDFVFTDQIINYKNWQDNSDSWSSQSAKITGSMLGYKHYISPTVNTNNVQLITNKDLSSFFVVVNNHYYNPEGKFAFPVLQNGGDKYMYVYWKKDENENFCLYMDLENKGQEVFKIENTCHLELYTRKPFLLFFQIERTGYEKPTSPGTPITYWTTLGELYKKPHFTISVTTTYNATHQDKAYITFYKPENFRLDETSLYVESSFSLNQGNTQITINNGTNVNLYNSFRSMQFLRQGNQRAFRPYSFFFEDDYKTKLTEIYQQAGKITDRKHTLCDSRGDCQITFPVDSTSWFESFVLSVAAQHYNSPAVVNDNTYIEVPDPIKGERFTPLDYENCDTLAIGCHIGNLGKTFYNTIGKFFSNIWNGFFEIIKGIFTWLFESIKNFPPIKWLIDAFHPMLVILWDYFMSYFTPIWDIFTGKTNLQDITWGDQEYICSKEPSNFIMESTTPAGKKPMEALGAFIYFINPLPPPEGAEICTGLGMKRIEYGKNTILDVFLFNIFVFAGIWFAFIGLRRYN